MHAAAAIASIVAAAGGNAGPGGAGSPMVRALCVAVALPLRTILDPAISGRRERGTAERAGGRRSAGRVGGSREAHHYGGPAETGIGRYKGMGCCSDLVWGDAFPYGAPTASVAASISTWVANNPWLAAGLAAAGLFLATKGGKRG